MAQVIFVSRIATILVEPRKLVVKRFEIASRSPGVPHGLGPRLVFVGLGRMCEGQVYSVQRAMLWVVAAC